MKSKILKAVTTGDVPEVRRLLVEAIRRGNSSEIDVVTYAIENTEGLFDADDGKTYPAAREMTAPHIAALQEDIKENFSIAKLQLLTDLYGTLNDEIPEATGDTRAPAEEPSAAEYSERKGTGKAARILGYILIILGAAAAIVGICIPINFLIGVGIGVILLGSVTAYSAFK